MRKIKHSILPIVIVSAGVLIGTGCVVSRTSPADITKVSPDSSGFNLTTPRNTDDQVQTARLKDIQSKKPSEFCQKSQSRHKSLIEKTRSVLELERQGLLSEEEAETLIRRVVNDNGR